MMQSVPLQWTCTSLILLLALTTGARGAMPAQAPGPRVVAVADIHGTLAGLTGILRAAGVIDAGDRWIGGSTWLVQTGDFLDRGPDVRRVMDLLMRLETEARRAGGRVDVLFGNHEGMNLLHDFRDVSPEAYAAFADGRSEDRRRRAFDAHAAIARRSGETLQPDAWMAAHPPGYVEYVEAIGPAGRYGRWLRARKAILQAGDTIFMHAGLHPATTASIDEVNRGVEREIRAWDTVVRVLERQRLIARTFTLGAIVNAAQNEIGRIVGAQKTGAPLGDHVTQDFVTGLQHLHGIETWALIAADGPLWYRGLATLAPDAQPAVEALLARHGAARFVVGHTPQLPGRITPRFGGRVILADTGMLATHYRGGQPAAVEILKGQVTAIYPGGREPVATPATRRDGGD